MFAAFFPLSWLCFGRFLQGKSSWWLAGATVLAWLQFHASLYLGVMGLMGLGVLWLLGLRRTRREVLLPVAALLPLLLLVWLQAQPYRAMQDELGATRGLHEAAVFSADLTGYLTPSRFPWGPRTILGEEMTRRIERPQRLDNMNFFGWAALFAAAVGLLLAWRHRSKPEAGFLLRLFVIGTMGFLLSLGPFLWISGEITSFKLPLYHVYTWLSPLRFMRSTARFGLMVLPVVAAAATFAIAHWRPFREGSRTLRFSVICAALAVLLLEYTPAHPPARTDVDSLPREALRRHAHLRIIAPIPWQEHRFLADTAETFVRAPSGHDGGSLYWRRDWLADRMSRFPSEESLDFLAAFDVEALLVYGEGNVELARGVGVLKEIETWPGGGLFRLGPVSAESVDRARATLSAVRGKPPLPESAEFPPDLPPETRWEPSHWAWLNDEVPPQWVPLEWQRMRERSFRFHDLHQYFYSGVPPRPLGEVPRVAVRMSIEDPGVEFVRARVFWLTVENGNWSPDRIAEAFVQSDGEERVVVFELDRRAAWNPAETLTALQFEFTTTPHPGQRVRVREIRIGGGVRENREIQAVTP